MFHVFLAGSSIGDHNSNHFRIVSKQSNDYDGAPNFRKLPLSEASLDHIGHKVHRFSGFGSFSGLEVDLFCGYSFIFI